MLLASRARKVDWFVVSFAIAGAVLLLSAFLPILGTILTTGIALLWETAQDPEVRSPLWLTFYAALWASFSPVLGLASWIG